MTCYLSSYIRFPSLTSLGGSKKNNPDLVSLMNNSRLSGFEELDLVNRFCITLAPDAVLVCVGTPAVLPLRDPAEKIQRNRYEATSNVLNTTRAYCLTRNG